MEEVAISDRVWIPSLSTEHLEERAAKIKPVIRFSEGPKGYFVTRCGFPCYIQPIGVHTRTYLSKPRYKERVFGLKPLRELKTYHPFHTPLNFSPSIADILAAIPEKTASKVVAFEIIELLEDEEAFAAGYHVAKTILYKKG